MNRFLILLIAFLGLFQRAGSAEPITPQELEFFEERIRPVLVEHCYECHNSQTAESGLVLDHREGMLSGGESGPVFASSARGSHLVKVIRHEIEGLEMPEGGPKLDENTIADFEEWIVMGAPDPRGEPPSAAELEKATSWEAIREKRKKWWSFQPIAKPDVPEGTDSWSGQPIDRFVFSRMATAGLKPSAEAGRVTLARRLSFALTGLPPTIEEVEAFVQDESNEAYGQLVDRLLNSKHFGERWARHWMDWIRYAESHGSEGDPRIEGAFHYRDYLIRALNSDVPYDQLIREHIAGDLIKDPRNNKELGVNESLIGTAHWRMVFHGFAPTDAMDEKVRFTDDAVNTFSKAFLGLTVSCARCHNHKFDAISQADYYALFGILGSTRPGRAVIDLPERMEVHRDKLIDLKSQIHNVIAAGWKRRLPVLLKQIEEAEDAEKKGHLLHTLFLVRQDEKKTGDFQKAWQSRVDEFSEQMRQKEAFETAAHSVHWKLSGEDDFAQWYAYGNGIPEKPSESGAFAISLEGDSVLAGIYPSGVYSHLISNKDSGRFTSPDFKLKGSQRLWLRVRGGGSSMSRYVVQNYPRSGTVYPVTEFKDEDVPWRWQQYDLKYWDGDDVHIELSTANDSPLLVKNKERSWFGIREAALIDVGEPAPSDTQEFLVPLFEAAMKDAPDSMESLARLYRRVISDAVIAWCDGVLGAEQALMLDLCISQGLLPNTLDKLPAVKPLIAKYRLLEAKIPAGRRVPTLAEWKGSNQRLLDRGDHKKPLSEVPRRFLEAIDATPYESDLSGRQELAADLLRDDNPFTTRVVVNRIWHHLFGRGLVATTDNFGRLGDQPSHPRLLDFLADCFRTEDAWSMKKMIRRIVMSKTWRQAAAEASNAATVDPENKLLSHYKVRRMEGEAIRDSILTVSGQLDRTMYGVSASGGSKRRSVYVNVIRNRLDPFLTTFDAPVPFSTKGRRDTTNVPAQSLLMMNDKIITTAALRLASNVLADRSLDSDKARVMEVWSRVLSRQPTDQESRAALQFMNLTKERYSSSLVEVSKLQSQIDERRLAIDNLLAPIREMLMKANESSSSGRPDLEPIAQWFFTESLDDIVGDAHVKLNGSAKIADGGLVLDGRGWASTGPLAIKSLGEKTLEVVTKLSTYDQRGGGAMTVQTTDGGIFDSIVFAERESRRWMAGSNNFARTESFQDATDEDLAIKEPVHLAITYGADGQITGYRNGDPYGKPYKTTLQQYSGNSTQVIFGMRHGTNLSSGRALKGVVFEARLYDRALSAEEIAACAGDKSNFVSRKQVIEGLSRSGREQLTMLEREVQDLELKLAGFDQSVRLDQHWIDFVHSLFNLKEFIYVR